MPVKDIGSTCGEYAPFHIIFLCLGWICDTWTSKCMHWLGDIDMLCISVRLVLCSCFDIMKSKTLCIKYIFQTKCVFHLLTISYSSNKRGQDGILWYYAIHMLFFNLVLQLIIIQDLILMVIWNVVIILLFIKKNCKTFPKYCALLSFYAIQQLKVLFKVTESTQGQTFNGWSYTKSNLQSSNQDKIILSSFFNTTTIL